jgi:antitoxin HicB
MTPNRYPQEVFWSDEDEGFIATAPDLPGCSAFGETREEAMNSLDEAILAWIGAAKAAGNPIPEASRPAERRYSGKLLVRMPKDLHGYLAREARSQEVSLNQFVLFLLTFASAQQAWNTSRFTAIQIPQRQSAQHHSIRRFSGSELVPTENNLHLFVARGRRQEAVNG